LCFVLSGKRKYAGWFIAGMAPAVLGWQIWATVHRSPAGDPITLFYTDYFGYYRADMAGANLGQMAWSNFAGLVKGLGELVVYDENITTATLTMARLLAAGIVMGAIRLVRQGRWRHYSAFSVIYIAQLLVWDSPTNSRFLLPLAPLIAVGIYSELRHLADVIAIAWKKGGADRLVAAVTCALLAGLFFYTANRVRFGIVEFLPSVFAAHQEALDSNRPAYVWIAEHTPSAALILSYRDPMLFLYTGRQGVSLRNLPHTLYAGNEQEREQSLVDQLDQARRLGIHYVLNTSTDYYMDMPESSRPAMSMALSHRDQFTPVFQTSSATVYEVRSR
jgi:hypothetical protein